MKHLYDQYGTQDFYFWDDTFTPFRKHAVNVFNAMIGEFHSQNRPITWQATTRCDCVDDELASLMKASGCRLITYGVETGSASMMEILRKGITHDKVFHAQDVMRKAGIIWDAFFMIGFPDDTPETIEETMSLIRRLECRSAAISIFTPYPGLEIYERAKRYNLISEPIEWRFFSHQSPKNHFVKDISREDFARIAAACLKEIDELNASRYRSDRLRYYRDNPRLIPRKAAEMLLDRIRSAGLSVQRMTGQLVTGSEEQVSRRPAALKMPSAPSRSVRQNWVARATANQQGRMPTSRIIPLAQAGQNDEHLEVCATGEGSSL